MRAEPRQTHAKQQRRAEMQARHRGNRQPEPVAGPHRAAPRRRGGVVQNVHEAVLRRQHPRRVTPPQRHNRKGNRVVHGNGPADAPKHRRRQHRVGINDEDDADDDVRVVDVLQGRHDARVVREHVRLERLFKVNVEDALDGEELQGVFLGEGVDVRIAGDGAGCKGAAELIYPIDVKVIYISLLPILAICVCEERKKRGRGIVRNEPVRQKPIPYLDQERKRAKDPRQQSKHEQVRALLLVLPAPN